MPGRPRRSHLFIPVYWLSSQIGWVNLNTNGMAQGAPGRVTAGCVFKDHRGVVIGLYCFNVGINTTFLMKILALIQCIEYAYQRGWDML